MPEDLYNEFIKKSGLVEQNYRIESSYENLQSVFENLLQANPDTTWLYVEQINKWGILSLKISFWSPTLRGRPLFEWQNTLNPVSFYKRPISHLFVLLFLAYLTRYFLVNGYRKRRRQVYEEFQSKRTEKKFKALARLEEARELAKSGQIAKALALVNEVLIELPRFGEAIELKKLLLLTQDASTAVMTSSPDDVFRSVMSVSMPTLLYLRILGTPYAYQAPSELESISIGRQRRKSGLSRDIGNDVVIRVPGSEDRSLRISRKHLEIRRIDTEYFVMNKSEGNTKLNGTILSVDKPMRLRSGDRLFIADVYRSGSLRFIDDGIIYMHDTSLILKGGMPKFYIPLLRWLVLILPRRWLWFLRLPVKAYLSVLCIETTRTIPYSVILKYKQYKRYRLSPYPIILVHKIIYRLPNGQKASVAFNLTEGAEPKTDDAFNSKISEYIAIAKNLSFE